MRVNIAAIVFALFSTSSYAADTFAEAAPAQAFNWSGGYVGLHAGYGWGTVHDVSNPRAVQQDLNGGFGGIQAGYNHQLSNNVVLGVEVDASFGGISEAFDGRSISVNNPYYTEDKIKALGTLRARLGYASDRFLPYVTGGLAWANVDHMLGCDAARVGITTECATKFETSKSDTSVGWAAGAGVEYALNDKWTVKGEYLFTDLGKNKVTLVDPNYPARSGRNFDAQFNTIRLGVNYRF